MELPAGDGVRRIVSGMAVAGVGFLLTRYPVLASLRTDVDLVAFLVGDVPVLVVGLGLTVYGVGLAASDRPAGEVVTVARWCVVGVVAMGAVVAATYLSVGRPMVEMTDARVVANVLLGSAVGGTVTGERSAATRRSRDALAARTDRLTVLNRVLRHEVLNSVNVIEGYAGMADGSGRRADDDNGRRAADVIRRRTDHIGAVFEDVGVIADTGGSEPVALDEQVDTAVDAVRRTHPEATVDVGALPTVDVEGNRRLHLAVEHLLDNAVEHAAAAAPRVRVEGDTTERIARLRVIDQGPGLPPEQRALLEERAFPEYDDPDSGFGLPFVRLMLDAVDGTVRVESPLEDGGGTAVTVGLRRADVERTSFGVPSRRLRRVAGSALVAGVVMGALIQAMTGGIAVIGALYASMNVGVGWVTHLFHSVVFGIGFAVATTNTRLGRYCTGTAGCVAGGVGYGFLLWLVAAGVVMPLWLRAVGVPAPVPNLGLGTLVGHVTWGATLGALVATFDAGTAVTGE